MNNLGLMRTRSLKLNRMFKHDLFISFGIKKRDAKKFGIPYKIIRRKGF